MGDRVYDIRLFGGPLDGETLKWQWNDDEDGRRGEEAGLIRMEHCLYRCNDERTEAYYVEVAMRFRLVGGPLDGAEVDATVQPGQDIEDLPNEGEARFGGLVYWLDRSKGIATYLRGRDEEGLLKKLPGIDGTYGHDKS